jgi:hypothetical protein
MGAIIRMIGSITVIDYSRHRASERAKGICLVHRGSQPSPKPLPLHLTTWYRSLDLLVRSLIHDRGSRATSPQPVQCTSAGRIVFASPANYLLCSGQPHIRSPLRGSLMLRTLLRPLPLFMSEFTRCLTTLTSEKS